jgi:uncharacterized membrane protein YciS (DUF1049 family)
MPHLLKSKSHMRPLITLSLLLPLQAKRLKDIKCVPVSAEKSLHISVAENLADLFVADFVVAVVLAGLYVIRVSIRFDDQEEGRK